jgi:pimeloyl-ACP methyl ester carboxylesterase
MPLVKVNAAGDRPVLDGQGDLDDTLARALAKLPEGAPVMVLIHGYKFSPARPHSNPHDHILSLTPRPDCWKALSWPRALGFGTGQAKEGLCVAFGWEARGSIWGAWERAAAAGVALADLLARLRAAGGPAAGVIGHSLGARVALSALPGLAPGDIGRMVLLAAAEFQGTARALAGTPAGRAAEIVNVTSRENALFDRLLEWCVPAPRPGERALGAGLPEAPRNWLDLTLDAGGTREALAALGHPIPVSDRRICHWSTYLRPGVFDLYAALLRAPEALPLALLRSQSAPAAPRRDATPAQPGFAGLPLGARGTVR